MLHQSVFVVSMLTDIFVTRKTLQWEENAYKVKEGSGRSFITQVTPIQKRAQWDQRAGR